MAQKRKLGPDERDSVSDRRHNKIRIHAIGKEVAARPQHDLPVDHIKSDSGAREPPEKADKAARLVRRKAKQQERALKKARENAELEKIGRRKKARKQKKKVMKGQQEPSVPRRSSVDKKATSTTLEKEHPLGPITKVDDQVPDRNGSQSLSKTDNKARRKARKQASKTSHKLLTKETGGNIQGIARRPNEENSLTSSKPTSTISLVKEARDINTKGATAVLMTQPHGESGGWRLTEPIGGQMLDIDPIFSEDEQFLLLAYGSFVAVYSTSTSLMVRQLRDTRSKTISDFTLTPGSDDCIYITRTCGIIEQWNWREGQRLNQWQGSSTVYSIAAVTQHEHPSSPVAIFTINRESHGPYLLCINHLRADKDAKLEDKILLKYDNMISSVKILEGGKFICAASGSQIILGMAKITESEDLQDITYTWYIVDSPEWVTCLDVRIADPKQPQQEPRKTSHRPIVPVDIVTGGLRGSIHVYKDLLRKVVRREKALQSGSGVDVSSQRLHWHRNAVSTVKWSKDGNYVISGGRETVLVIWQLDTGSKDTLPHLGAPVSSVTISPQGSSYAIRLADNSVMILSTSELRPSFSVAGIQVRTLTNDDSNIPSLPTVDDLYQRRGHFQIKGPPVCSAFSRPGQLLLAVPPITTSHFPSATPISASHLQTFNVASVQQISRQALTRTKITDLNMGPEFNTIEEPNVIHIQTSSDGSWLATVDEWAPPKNDVIRLAFDEERVDEERAFRAESCLKFWSWDDLTRTWELNTRIDHPHTSESGNPYVSSRVLDLATDPSSNAFATIGEDGIVRSWKPTIRRRDGLPVKNSVGKSLTTWRCHHSTPVEEQLPVPEGMSTVSGAKVAYSPDGSIVAVAVQSPSVTPIYLVDTDTGILRNIQSGLSTGPILGIGIIDRYLIVLSQDLCVWDLVYEELHYGMDLKLDAFSHISLLAKCHLAVDTHHQTFAVAIPEIGSGPKATTRVNTRIAIMAPFDSSPLFYTTLNTTVTALIPAAGRKAFFAIDSDAHVRTLLPKKSVPTSPMSLPSIEETAHRGLDSIFGNGSKEILPASEGMVSEQRKDADDVVVVSQERLAEIFDTGPAYAPPPIADLFEQVAGLYCGIVAA